MTQPTNDLEPAFDDEHGVYPEIEADYPDVSIDDEPPLQELDDLVKSGEGVELDPPTDNYLPVEWVPREACAPNDWNPYYLVEQQYDLLVQSILDNGWTQPIVVRDAPEDADAEYEIIDGEQRWTVSGDSRIHSHEDLSPPDEPAGHVPIFNVSMDDLQARVSTMQHNENVGEHNMMKLGQILEDLEEVDMGGVFADRVGLDKFDIKNLKDATPTEVDYPDADDYFELPEFVPDSPDTDEETTEETQEAVKFSILVVEAQRTLLEKVLTTDTHVQALISIIDYCEREGLEFDGTNSPDIGELAAEYGGDDE